uniref:BTB domain-containing protein n=1 Tax=Panagrellus redivivus TaxID=6233 RepID=A0A7E4W5R9_PANRE
MGIRDKGLGGLRGGNLHNSEHSLPEKLSQALKALRPGVLSHSSSGSSPFSKSGVVDADDVVYYTSVDKYPINEPSSSSHEKRSSKGKILANQRKSKSVFTKHSSPSTNDLSARFNHGVMLKDVKSLDQIRHLYKSVPNVSSYDDSETQTPGVSRRFHDDSTAELSSNSNPRTPSIETQKLLNTDTYITATSSSVSSLGTNQSPTDSGYRSTPRHVVINGGEPKPPPLPDNPPPSQSPSFVQRNILRSEKENRQASAASGEYVHSGGPMKLEPFYASTPSVMSGGVERKLSSCLASSMSGSRSKKASENSGSSPLGSAPIDVKLPIDDRDVLNVIQKGRCKQHAHLITLGVVPKLTNALTVPLLRICTEASRLAKPLVKCTMNDIRYATMLCLPETVAEECIKAAVQATTLYALSGSGALRVSMSRRAGLNFCVGSFYRWMIDSRIASIIADTAAIYLCAVIECLLEKLLSALSETIGSANIQQNQPWRAILFAGKTENVTEDIFDKLVTTHTDICQFLRAHELRDSKKYHKKYMLLMCAQTEAELRSILDHLYRKLHSSSSLFDQNNRRSKNALYFGKQAISSLFYFTRCKGAHCSCSNAESAEEAVKLYDWLRFILYFVDYRRGMHVDQHDVLQAARLLLPNVDCPPYPVDLVIASPALPGSIVETKRRRQDMAFMLLMSADSEMVPEAYALLGNHPQKVVNDYGLTAISQAVITRNEDAVRFLVSNNSDVNVPVPVETTSQASALSLEFAGWTPLSWAVAYQDAFTVSKLLEACADVDSSYMIRETPLQLSIMTGDADIFARLVSCGANAFHSTINYDSLDCNFRTFGSPCALAVAAAFGRIDFVNIMLNQSSLTGPAKVDMSLADFLNESTDVQHKNKSRKNDEHSSPFQKLPRVIQKASKEAMYYAVETAQLDIAMQFRRLGVPWNIYSWTKCLQTAYDLRDRNKIKVVLDDFSTRLSDELTGDIIDETVAILFDVIRFETRQQDGNPALIARIISDLNRKFSEGIIPKSAHNSSKQGPMPSASAVSLRPIIDPKYADNSELSDIRFRIDDKVIYAHRIVLVNASEELKRLLDNPSGVIDLDNVSYDVFKVLIDNMYGNRQASTDKIISEGLPFQLETMEAALTFGLEDLTKECYEMIKSEMSAESCVRIYRFAQRCGIQSLINDCELFILRNFVSLVNNDQLRVMLQRSGQPGWCDICAALANRLVEAFEVYMNSEAFKRKFAHKPSK